MDVYGLDSPRSPAKSRRFLSAIIREAQQRGLKCEVGTSYKDCDLLVVYGVGGHDRFGPSMRHMSSGKPLLCFDLGYWDRKLPLRKYRFSLNGVHPTQVMDGGSPDGQRFKQSGLTIERNTVNQDGPIMLVGNAPKSIVIGAKNWTADTSRKLRHMFPSRKILFRPKPKRPKEAGVKYDKISSGPIDEEIKKCSLVVCRHSNVAVDACRLGIPVACDDGAAACIYPDIDRWDMQPDRETQTEFLHRLAWWQWGLNEAELFWDWFFNTFPSHDNRKPDNAGNGQEDKRSMASEVGAGKRSVHKEMEYPVSSPSCKGSDRFNKHS